MDEPFGALDEMTRERMNQEVLRIWEHRDHRRVRHHSIPEAVFLSSRVVVMSARPGRITDVIEIDLPRPRDVETREQPRYFELVTAVREALRRGGDHAEPGVRQWMTWRRRLGRPHDGRRRDRVTVAATAAACRSDRRARRAGHGGSASTRRPSSSSSRPSRFGRSPSVPAPPVASRTDADCRGAGGELGRRALAARQGCRCDAVRGVGGLIIGTVAGVLVAFATARYATARELLLPLAIGASAVPIIAFAPLMNNWFGVINPLSKMMMVAVLVFFPIVVNVTRGLTQVEPAALELMRSYAASEGTILRVLRIPMRCRTFSRG